MKFITIPTLAMRHLTKSVTAGQSIRPLSEKVTGLQVSTPTKSASTNSSPTERVKRSVTTSSSTTESTTQTARSVTTVKRREYQRLFESSKEEASAYKFLVYPYSIAYSHLSRLSRDLIQFIEKVDSCLDVDKVLDDFKSLVERYKVVRKARNVNQNEDIMMDLMHPDVGYMTEKGLAKYLKGEAVKMNNMVKVAKKNILVDGMIKKSSSTLITNSK